MKKILISAFVLMVSCSALFAQEQAETETMRKRNEADQRVYQLALRYNDLPVARMKLMELIERNPTNIRYQELLATLYFDSNQFTSAAVSAMDLLEKNDKNVAALEIAGYSLEQLGAFDRAMPYFESHYLLTGTLFSLYKTAYMQFSLDRFEEALNSANMLVKDAKSSTEMLNFTKADETTQEVSIKAAALNLKGLIYMAEKNVEEAQTAFMQSLELAPGFEMAQLNMRELRNSNKQ
ncbi:tetratricopeptide repeat protein [Mongoliitalea daihaiensis]|uniref:tetratricopeptide repeat protein n=1 Tax=Mongoliitalea daihaiensis TaxID=2782006 RepID=UPI001F33A7BE|nr:tetratricopeptide repeat protein [Mongoliitalea daihaiensis]UJP63576.1 tetratricopeptide repeat protein [Mongoliitalea daihaiensis]